MYRIKERVRYSEIDLDKKVNIARIVNYFQDCSTFHSEDLGQGLDYIYAKSRAWLLVAWQIEVDRYPQFTENISIGTWAYDFNVIYGLRNFDIIDENGIRIAKANSVWVFVDTVSGKPVPITEEQMNLYNEGDEKLEMNYKSRKIKLPKETVEYEQLRVLKMHIDTNNHVNNAKYIEIAQEYLPKNFIIKQMRVDYKKAAMLHDMMIPKVSEIEGGYIVQLCDTKNLPYVVLEFLE